MSNAGRKLKHYDKNTLSKIVSLINDGILSLKKIMIKIHTHRNVFYRNMLEYYGVEEWDKLVAHYLSRRGIQKGTILSPSTMFKKGGPLRYINARRWRPIGALQIKRRKIKTSGRGRSRIRAMRFIKVADEPYGKNNWTKYSRWLWEQTYGTIPKGKCIVHLDDDTLNDDLENYACLTRAEYVNYLESRFPDRLARRKRLLAKTRLLRRRSKAKISRSFFECLSCGYENDKFFEQCLKCSSYSCQKILLKEKIA